MAWFRVRLERTTYQKNVGGEKCLWHFARKPTSESYAFMKVVSGLPKVGRIPHPQPDATAEFQTYVPNSAFASAKRIFVYKRADNRLFYILTESMFPSLFVTKGVDWVKFGSFMGGVRTKYQSHCD